MDLDATVSDLLKAMAPMLAEQLHFRSPNQIMSMLGSGYRTRSAVEFVHPPLTIENDMVLLAGKPLFSLDTALICQLIHLKPFLCPENKDFFVAWLRRLNRQMKTEEGRTTAFCGTYEAEAWFDTPQPSIDSENPLEGVLETINAITQGF